MATIDFSTLTEAKFNGTALTEINYNGTSVWTTPVGATYERLLPADSTRDFRGHGFRFSPYIGMPYNCNVFSVAGSSNYATDHLSRWGTGVQPNSVNMTHDSAGNTVLACSMAGSDVIYNTSLGVLSRKDKASSSVSLTDFTSPVQSPNCPRYGCVTADGGVHVQSASPSYWSGPAWIHAPLYWDEVWHAHTVEDLFTTSTVYNLGPINNYESSGAIIYRKFVPGYCAYTCSVDSYSYYFIGSYNGKYYSLAETGVSSATAITDPDSFFLVSGFGSDVNITIDFNTRTFTKGQDAPRLLYQEINGLHVDGLKG